MHSRGLIVVFALTAVVGLSAQLRSAGLLDHWSLGDSGQSRGAKPQTYKGLDVAVSGVQRATIVSLTDCPPGANSVRGVIKPGDTTEFASVTVDFKVTPAFKPGMLPKPVLHDAAGKTYNTAQSFADIGSSPAFSCTFAFRVPKGTPLKRFALDTLSIDLAGTEK